MGHPLGLEALGTVLGGNRRKEKVPSDIFLGQASPISV